MLDDLLRRSCFRDVALDFDNTWDRSLSCLRISFGARLLSWSTSLTMGCRSTATIVASWPSSLFSSLKLSKLDAANKLLNQGLLTSTSLSGLVTSCLEQRKDPRNAEPH